MSKEKLITIFTVGSNCGLSCAFCTEGNNKEFVLPIEPSDIATLGSKLGKFDEIRFGGNAGDFFLQFNPEKVQELLKASVACLDGSATRTDRGYGRIQIITNGLFISKEHLEALLKYKDYITFVVSVDLGHHNGSKCKMKYDSLAELCKSGHQNECLYFNTITTSILLMQKMGFSLMINAVQREREREPAGFTKNAFGYAQYRRRSYLDWDSRSR